MLLTNVGITYTIKEGEGAFYGPKIDFDIEDSMGNADGSVALFRSISSNQKILILSYVSLQGDNRTSSYDSSELSMAL